MLVIMALVTTYIAGPALRIIDRHGALAVQPEIEVERADARPILAGAVMVACQDAKNMGSLVALARSLVAGAQNDREIILVRLLEPSSTGTRWSRDRQAVAGARAELKEQVDALTADGIPSRGVPIITAHLASDLNRLTNDESIDVILADGRRSLTVNGLPGGAVGVLLREAACDVAVLVERRTTTSIDREHPVVVPFGGSDHDWAAIEIGSKLADAHDASLRLVGVAQEATRRSAADALSAAAVAVQSISGLNVETTLVESGGVDVIAAAQDAGMLVIGLSARWREEGLGSVREQIAAEADAATLFVRRGSRAGLIAPNESMTQFGWSSANLRAKTAEPPTATDATD